MISLKLAQEVHSLLIKNFGGTHGIRSVESLASALTRPFQTFENIQLYVDPVAKAAALIESIISNHPFVDGNKRTGYVLTRLFLMSNNIDILASEEEKYELVISIASGNKNYAEILEWFKTHTKQIHS